MRIDVLTIFPKFFENAFDFSIVKKAKEKKLVTIEIHDIRKYSSNIADSQIGVFLILSLPNLATNPSEVGG